MILIGLLTLAALGSIIWTLFHISNQIYAVVRLLGMAVTELGKANAAREQTPAEIDLDE